MTIDFRALARSLALSTAAAVAATLATALVFFSNNPDAVLADPKAWLIGVASAAGRAVVAVLAVKIREFFTVSTE